MSGAPKDPHLAAYLERLEDLLPAREADRVRLEVEGMILDRAEAERERDPALSESDAIRLAVGGWKQPEALADELVRDPLTIDLASRRAFIRTWLVVFAVHLVLSIVLTVAGSGSAAIPGILGPLASKPWHALVGSVLAILAMDAGFVLGVFVLLRRRLSSRALPALGLGPRWTRRSAIEGLILIGLLALIVNVFRDAVFAVRDGDGVTSFLGRGIVDLVPWINGVLGAFALRHVLVLAGRPGHVLTWLVELIACAGAIVVLAMAARAEPLVSFPTGTLGDATAGALDNLVSRVLLLVFVVAVLLLAVRFVRVGLRLVRTLQGGSA